MWKLDGTELQTLDGHESSVKCVSFCKDEQILASASSDKTIKLWHRNGEKWSCHKTLKGHRQSVNSISFIPDGKILISGSDDRTALLWFIDELTVDI